MKVLLLLGLGAWAALAPWAHAAGLAPAQAAAAPASGPSPARAVAAAPEAAKPAQAGITGLRTAQRRADGAQVVRGTLGGNGVIADAKGTRVIEGKVAPGNSPGCVSDQGNVVFEGGATLEIEIGGPTPCTQFDQYTVALKLTLNSPTLNVLLINGFVPVAGQRFDVLNWGTLVGTFGQVNLPALPPGLRWDASALHTTGELAVNGPPADGDVPLPPWALAALGAGLAAMLVRQHRH